MQLLYRLNAVEGARCLQEAPAVTPAHMYIYSEVLQTSLRDGFLFIDLCRNFSFIWMSLSAGAFHKQELDRGLFLHSTSEN